MISPQRLQHYRTFNLCISKRRLSLGTGSQTSSIGCGARRSMSELEADFSEVPPGLLMTKCVRNVFQRIARIDHGSNGVCLDRANHIELLAAVAHCQALHAQLLAHDA